MFAPGVLVPAPNTHRYTPTEAAFGEPSRTDPRALECFRCAEWARLHHICTRTGAHPCHIGTGTGRTPATSAPGLVLQSSRSQLLAVTHGRWCIVPRSARVLALDRGRVQLWHLGIRRGRIYVLHDGHAVRQCQRHLRHLNTAATAPQAASCRSHILARVGQLNGECGVGAGSSDRELRPREWRAVERASRRRWSVACRLCTGRRAPDWLIVSETAGSSRRASEPAHRPSPGHSQRTSRIVEAPPLSSSRGGHRAAYGRRRCRLQSVRGVRGACECLQVQDGSVQAT